MAEMTDKAAMLVRMFTAAGAKPYLMLRGEPCTSKVARLLMPTGNPVMIQTNCKTPRVWLLPEHERGAFSCVGEIVPYKAWQPRHHHLTQVTEFAGRAMIKVEVSSERWPDIQRAVETVCSRSVRI